MRSVRLPELWLITDGELKDHRQELQKTVGHYGLQAKELADRFAWTGLPEHVYFYFAPFD